MARVAAWMCALRLIERSVSRNGLGDEVEGVPVDDPGRTNESGERPGRVCAARKAEDVDLVTWLVEKDQMAVSLSDIVQ